MAVLDSVPATILASRLIASVDGALARRFGLEDGQRSLAFFTCDFDDVGYVACDEATKMAAVSVVYASSFYAGAAHASAPNAGEFIGALAAENPADALAGLRAAADYVRRRGAFRKADAEGRTVFFAELISSVGSYLAGEAKVPEGGSLAYLIAPPLEAAWGLDAALKAADVELVRHFPPPSPTNFSGGWLAGAQAACQAAVDAFTQAVLEVAEDPLGPLGRAQERGPGCFTEGKS